MRGKAKNVSGTDVIRYHIWTGKRFLSFVKISSIFIGRLKYLKKKILLGVNQSEKNVAEIDVAQC